MKKILFTTAAALLMGVIITSCSKDDIIESTNTVWTELTIHTDDWKIDPDTKDLYCAWNWPIIDEDVLACGNVMAYYYQNGRQVPLPFVRRWEYVNPNTGLVDQVPINFRFDVEPGVITFVISDLSEYRLDPAQLPEIIEDEVPMVFRAVCTYPVLYRI